MEPEEIKIEVYDKRDKSITVLYVEQLSDNKFRMTDNDLFDYRLTLGTEFETRINQEGKHEIIRITKESTYLTRRFLLSDRHKTSDYQFLGEELVKRGGHWQVDMGGIITINLPKNAELDVDRIIKELGLNLIEIVNEGE
ncbi:hypothetical protein QNI16_21655 [Cytophagaceae bacterium YF14B1]|uniref:Uncharacterized protein n=1 Tax=Xanthocytophaga flava TaxID=3048013 RepID=A0AAE3U7P1_9BACT|nr:hypothetical protein [Xanthocytophaga flavus]MDJ1483119.1 hypothetical protein [Xanthocytophaga flavus]